MSEIIIEVILDSDAPEEIVVTLEEASAIQLLEWLKVVTNA